MKPPRKSIMERIVLLLYWLKFKLIRFTNEPMPRFWSEIPPMGNDYIEVAMFEGEDGWTRHWIWWFVHRRVLVMEARLIRTTKIYHVRDFTLEISRNEQLYPECWSWSVTPRGENNALCFSVGHSKGQYAFDDGMRAIRELDEVLENEYLSD